MPSPAVALAAFFVATLVLALAVWPRRGIAARIGRLRRHTARVLAEDALKHAYHCEADGLPATIDSVAGALDASRARSVAVVEGLVAGELLRPVEAGLALTDAGRRYAVHIVRSHRLWERYLADRTGVGPGDWHHEADVVEHRLSRADADLLSARMGDPLFDPHGDPIPTAAGDAPPRGGLALSSLRAGEAATIVHIEDEPDEVYRQLVAAGLAPGMRVRVREATPAEVRVEAGTGERRLAPVAAASVTVVREAAAAEPPAGATLASVRPGAEATVLGLSAACQGPQRRRLLDLGLVPGTRVRAEMASALGDPLAYRIRDALIALRRDQAAWVRVEAAPAAPGARP